MKWARNDLAGVLLRAGDLEVGVPRAPTLGAGAGPVLLLAFRFGPPARAEGLAAGSAAGSARAGSRRRARPRPFGAGRRPAARCGSTSRPRRRSRRPRAAAGLRPGQAARRAGWCRSRPARAARLELVFLGEGRLEAEPPDAIEAAQLELFTGRRRLDSRVHRRHLRGARSALGGNRCRRRRAGPSSRRAAGRAGAVRSSPASQELAELAVLDVDSKLLLAALGEPLADQYFAAVFDTVDHGVVCLGNDLEAEDPLGIGQWVALESVGRRSRRRRPAAPPARRPRRRRPAAPTTPGSRAATSSRPAPAASATFEPRHYDLAVALDPAGGRLSGSAEIPLEAQLARGWSGSACTATSRSRPSHDGDGNELFLPARRRGPAGLPALAAWRPAPPPGWFDLRRRVSSKPASAARAAACATTWPSTRTPARSTKRPTSSSCAGRAAGRCWRPGTWSPKARTPRASGSGGSPRRPGGRPSWSASSAAPSRDAGGVQDRAGPGQRPGQPRTPTCRRSSARRPARCSISRRFSVPIRAAA